MVRPQVAHLQVARHQPNKIGFNDPMRKRQPPNTVGAFKFSNRKQVLTGVHLVWWRLQEGEVVRESLWFQD